jgi:DNA-binding XRE family transcriptional regulator
MNAFMKPLAQTDDSVTISRADYDAMVELLADAEDIRDAAAVAAKLVTGETEAYPVEVMNRLLDGDHPVRVFRDYRGLTAQELADRADISRAYLSEMENRSKPGSLKAMTKLAAALSVPLDLLAAQ